MKIKILLLSLLISVGFGACQKEDPFKVEKGNYILSEKNPIKKNNQRVASVSTQITELICEMGCMDRLVCRTDFCLYPEQVRQIPSIGGVNNPDIEKIISLKPDLVISSSIMPKKYFDILENAGLPILAFKESPSIEGMYTVLNLLGKILDKKAVSDSIINSCKQRIQALKQQSDKSHHPSAYYVVGFGPAGDFSAGKDTYINELLTLAGVDNIAKESKVWAYSQEQLLKHDPEYIFIRPQDKEQFCNTHPYNQLSAVKNNKVFGIDGLDSQTPRSITAAEKIQCVSHQQTAGCVSHSQYWLPPAERWTNMPCGSPIIANRQQNGARKHTIFATAPNYSQPIPLPFFQPLSTHPKPIQPLPFSFSLTPPNHNPFLTPTPLSLPPNPLYAQTLK